MVKNVAFSILSKSGGYRSIAKERLVQRLHTILWRTAPPVFKDILNRCRVVFTVYPGTSMETIKEIPNIDPFTDDVRILNYTATYQEVDADGNLMSEQKEIYVLGLEDLGITLADGRTCGRDDWKELIVSIRYFTDYTTDPPTEEIWLTFQVSYSRLVVYLDENEVFRSTKTSADSVTATPAIITVLRFNLDGNLSALISLFLNF